MTDDQLTALVREYAEETFKDDESNPDLPICLLNEMRKENAEYVEDVIRFLLRRFCLVEKSKVEEEYRTAKECLDKVPTLSIIGRVINGQIIALESLFPEIAKKVEK